MPGLRRAPRLARSVAPLAAARGPAAVARGIPGEPMAGRGPVAGALGSDVGEATAGREPVAVVLGVPREISAVRGAPPICRLMAAPSKGNTAAAAKADS